MNDHVRVWRRLSDDESSALSNIARSYGLTLNNLRVRDRSTAYVRARAACWAYLKTGGWSYPEICADWGYDRSSVLHAVRMHTRRSVSSRATRTALNVLRLEAQAFRLDDLSAQLLALARRVAMAAADVRDALRDTPRHKDSP